MNAYMSHFPSQTQRNFIRFLKRLGIYTRFVQNFHKESQFGPNALWRVSSTTIPLVSAFDWEETPQGFDFWNYVYFLWVNGNSRILTKDINHIRTEKHNLLTYYTIHNEVF